MGTETNRFKMLFIFPTKWGREIGKQLIQYDIRNYEIQEAAINDKEVGFYKHLGFEIYKLTDCDKERKS